MVPEEYIRLALRLDRHIDGLVDAYYGPAALKDEIAREEPVPLPTLRREADGMIQRLPAEIKDPARRLFLSKQLEALAAQIDDRTGQITDFREYVGKLFDVDPGPADEAELGAFRQSIAALLSRIGYTGPLRDALARWEEDRYLADEALLDYVNDILKESREKTSRIIDLPPGEKVRVQGVRNQPWSGYNWYQGNYSSLIQVNLDMPRTRMEAYDLATHEAYPGHHTDHAAKEKALYHDLGYLEASIALINTPSSVTSEGIASTAGMLIAPDGLDIDQQIATLLRKLRRGCDVNATLMLHADGASLEVCLAYLEANGLMPPQRAAKRIGFLTHPLWRAYSFTYWAGGRLVEEFQKRARETGKLSQALNALYYQQMTPTGLQKRMAEM